MKFIALMLLLLIQGCASKTPPDLRKMAENKQWQGAYENIMFVLSKNNKEDTERVIALTKDYPEIIGYAVEEYSFEGLTKSDDKDNIQYRKDGIRFFCTPSSEEQCNTANENLLKAEKSIKKEFSVIEDLYLKLTPQEQKVLSDKYKLLFYKSSEFGIVTDRQVQNTSTPGSNDGAVIGGAVGTTAYISNATPSSYSMKSDIASTALGALAGAMLFNKSPVVQYLIRYTIKLRNGEVIQVDQISGTPLGQGIGMCISASNASLIDQSYCTMTLAEFKTKFSEQLKN